MSKNIESLWPSLSEIKLPLELAPVIVLQEQAEAIGEETNNIIEGQVILEKVFSSAAQPGNVLDPSGEKPTQSYIENEQHIRHSLFVRAPLLNGYRVRIVSITHKNSELYPLKIHSKINEDPVISKIITNHEELTEALHDVLQSAAVRGVLSSLLAQSGYQQAA